MAEGDKQVILGSGERPLRVAVIGSGPSGFYAAEAVLNQKDLAVEVDMFDRLPTPYGLVRGGVAPDHQKIKQVTVVYERIAAKPGFRFFGHVHFGRDLSEGDLRRHYDQLVYAVGNESDRRLKIPGEDLAGSHSATAFVGWYNGHPDWRDQEFDLSQERAAVIGVGNVAMDVTRILAETPDALAKTDIADYALETLRKSRVREIWLLGRRGPAQAAFSPAEIKEIGELQSADLVVRPEELGLDDISKKSLETDPEAKKIVDFLALQAKKGEGARGRKVRLRFFMSPIELIGENGRVARMTVELNELVPDGKGGLKAKGTGKTELLPAGLVFRSVGYHGVPLPGVPFDPKAGHIPNQAGRVIEETGQVVPAAYVVGWAKRGPSGLIGTNRADSMATVKCMLADAAGKSAVPDPAKTAAAALETIRARQPDYVSFQDWKNLEKAELARGAAKGKIREKFTRVPEMLVEVKKARGTAVPA